MKQENQISKACSSNTSPLIIVPPQYWDPSWRPTWDIHSFKLSSSWLTCSQVPTMPTHTPGLELLPGPQLCCGFSTFEMEQGRMPLVGHTVCSLLLSHWHVPWSFRKYHFYAFCCLPHKPTSSNSHFWVFKFNEV